MRTIQVRKRAQEQISKGVLLGNGVRKQFASKREAGYFLAETNRFLTESLVIINQVYTDLYVQYRQMWLAGTEWRESDIIFKTKTCLSGACEVIDKYASFLKSAGDPYFSFIDLKKACFFCSEAAAVMEAYNEKRNFTPQKYQCRILKKRCMIIQKTLNEYGQ